MPVCCLGGFGLEGDVGGQPPNHRPAMAAASGSATASRLEEVNRALRDTSHQLAAARKRQARADAAEAAEPADRNVSARGRRVAVTVYVLSQHRPAAAAAFLAGARARRSRLRREAAAASWRRRVEDWFLGMGADDIAALGFPANPWESRILHAARVFHTEFALCEFVIRANEDRGLAPRTQELRTEAKAVWQRHEEFVVEGQPVPRAWLYPQAFAVWASRWGRRWGGRGGALRAREHVPVEVRRAKAAGSVFS